MGIACTATAPGLSMQTFSSLGLSENLLEAVVVAGYSNPTPIQARAIPVACQGRDLIGCAQTGTGKTAAFVLPVLERLAAGRHSHRGYRDVRALVVTPTRELALQVEESVRTYGAFTNVRSQTIFGGVAMGPQLQRLRRGTDIVVATPGRLLDILDRGAIDLSRVEVLVLDEADRMLDMGFIRDIRRIVAAVPEKRQTMLFSATMPQAVESLASSILHEPEFVEVGERRNPAETIAQQVSLVPQDQKMDLLLHVLATEPVASVIVFARTKHRADRITKKLGQHGFAATAMHSNKTQSQRQRALEGFRTGRFTILVATDIAARGIDVDRVSHVINFDTPNQAEDYVHRIGRTGRAAAVGDAITFVASDEMTYLREIERHTGRKIPRKVYDGFESPKSDAVVAERAGGQTKPSGPNPQGARQNRRRGRTIHSVRRG